MVALAHVDTAACRLRCVLLVASVMLTRRPGHASHVSLIRSPSDQTAVRQMHATTPNAPFRWGIRAHMLRDLIGSWYFEVHISNGICSDKSHTRPPNPHYCADLERGHVFHCCISNP